jgi:hypothetical protein
MDISSGGHAADAPNAGKYVGVYFWNPGDGSETIDGGKGFDTLQFNTSGASENISVLDFGGHAVVTRDVDGVTLDLQNIERIAFGGDGGGQDNFFISQLDGTAVKEIDIALGPPGGDGAADVVGLTGEAGGDKITFVSAADGLHVKGLSAEVVITGADTFDRVAVNGLDGKDTFDATGFSGGIGLQLNGGAGADRFVFGEGAGGKVRIVDFQGHANNGQGDQIVLHGFSDHSFDQAVADGYIAQVGDSVVISYAGVYVGASAISGPEITLQHTQLADLRAADFLFS